MFRRLDTKDRRKLKRNLDTKRFVVEYTNPDTKESMVLYIDTKRKQCMINNKNSEGVSIAEMQCLANTLDREIIGDYIEEYPGLYGFFNRKHEKEQARLEAEMKALEETLNNETENDNPSTDSQPLPDPDPLPNDD